MSRLQLRVGPLVADGYVVQRSGIRWLKENGHYCHPGELIAHCNIGLALGNGGSNTAPPFKDEMQELQVGFATKIGGRLFQSESSSLGGYLDHLYHYQEWVPQSVIGEIEPEKEDSVGPALEQGALSLFMFAGRRSGRSHRAYHQGRRCSMMQEPHPSRIGCNWPGPRSVRSPYPLRRDRTLW